MARTAKTPAKQPARKSTRKSARKSTAKRPTTKARGGRPTKYRQEFVALAEELCLLGATDKELAAECGVDEATLHRWKKKHPEFRDTIARAKRPTDGKVARALRDRALGAEWTEEVAIKVKEVEYEEGKRVREVERVEVVELRKAAPPDTNAASLWLRNRDPERWRDRHELEVNDQSSLAEKLRAARERVARDRASAEGADGDGE